MAKGRTVSTAHLFLCGTLVGLVLAPAAEAGSLGYHLFNPTPRGEMRPLSADRPDSTESPVTVDAGHFQAELSFFDYTLNQDDGVEVRGWSILDMNLKVGLLDNLDLQVVFSAHSIEDTRGGRPRDETVGSFGDVQVRAKVNLWGNDGGETAFGLIPFVTIPTGTRLSVEKAEGGLIAMMSWDVMERLGLGFQAEIDLVHEPVEDTYDAEFLHTVVAGFHTYGPLGAYLEYVGVAGFESGSQMGARCA